MKTEMTKDITELFSHASAEEIREMQAQLMLARYQNPDGTGKLKVWNEESGPGIGFKPFDPDTLAPFSPDSLTFKARIHDLSFMTEEQYREHKKLIDRHLSRGKRWWTAEKKALVGWGARIFKEIIIDGDTYYWDGRETETIKDFAASVVAVITFETDGAAPLPGTLLDLTQPGNFPKKCIVLDSHTAILKDLLGEGSWEFALRKLEDLKQKLLAPGNGAELKTGYPFLFGMYPVKRYGWDEELRWLAVGRTEKGVLLLSEKILSCQPMEKEKKDFLPWEESSLQKWLNTDFLDRAFSPEEQKSILPVKTRIITKAGETTVREDRVFLLSEEELKRILRSLACAPTQHSLNKDWGLPKTFRYWLRSNVKEKKAKMINEDGQVEEKHCYTQSVGVRPALWLKV